MKMYMRHRKHRTMDDALRYLARAIRHWEQRTATRNHWARSEYASILAGLRGGGAATARNVLGRPLKRCHPRAGSSDADGYCNLDRVHSVCVRSLPADFASRTGQGRWSESHAGEPWCVCGARAKMYDGTLDVDREATREDAA